ncbi:MAG TPA: hypothetical protein EYH07_08755 [Kiloniellaceae bacterium]|nr:hypothetical protein [Kiloniellaceae bacterium]
MARARSALVHGCALARSAGRESPDLRDAIWELLMEAADTLSRLPNRERGWLTAASRAHWPDVVRHYEESLQDGRAPSAATALRRSPASAEAIDRMDTVLAWLPLAGGSNPRRDLAVLFGLACGAKVAVLRRRFGCGRRTIYDIRDRALRRLCAHVASELGLEAGAEL